jgi:MbtH protein
MQAKQSQKIAIRQWYPEAAMDNNDDKTVYRAVVNHEEQYSIWPAHRDLPLGWRDAGKSGTKTECLEHISQVWTDMRPLSLRKKMEQTQQAALTEP